MELVGPGRLISVGYEGRDLGELLAELSDHGVDVLVDTRESAMSRRRGFAKRALSEACLASGIDYLHLRALGNPKANRDAFRAGDEAARQRYVAHLNNGSRSAYDSVIELTESRVVALLCFERDHATCHRSCIAEQAQQDRPGLVVELI